MLSDKQIEAFEAIVERVRQEERQKWEKERAQYQEALRQAEMSLRAVQDKETAAHISKLLSEAGL